MSANARHLSAHSRARRSRRQAHATRLLRGRATTRPPATVRRRSRRWSFQRQWSGAASASCSGTSSRCATGARWTTRRHSTITTRRSPRRRTARPHSSTSSSCCSASSSAPTTSSSISAPVRTRFSLSFFAFSLSFISTSHTLVIRAPAFGGSPVFRTPRRSSARTLRDAKRHVYPLLFCSSSTFVLDNPEGRSALL